MAKSTNYMIMFNSFLYVYQAGYLVLQWGKYRPRRPLFCTKQGLSWDFGQSFVFKNPLSFHEILVNYDP